MKTKTRRGRKSGLKRSRGAAADVPTISWPRPTISAIARFPSLALADIDAFKDEMKTRMGGPSRRERFRRLYRKGIIGVGFGVKISENEVVAYQCLRVYVRAKHRQRDLPETHRIPKFINGLPTDVIVLAQPRAHVALCGDSVGHPAVPYGTIGCVVEKSGRRYILSNNHILANCGDTLPNAETWQPGRDLGGSSPGIGHLAEFEALKFKTGINEMDAAIASINDPAAVIPQFKKYGTIRPDLFVNPPATTAVQKYGAFTRHQEGRIEGVRDDIRLNYGSFGSAVFNNQLVIRGTAGLFSDQGDSGSLVLSMDLRPVALLIGGDLGKGVSFATPIKRVLDQFGVTIVT